MPDVQRILGLMMTNGLGWRSRRGADFAQTAQREHSSGGGGGFLRGAGLAALGVLAYRTYRDYQANRAPQGSGAAPAPATQREPSLLDRITGIFKPSRATGAGAGSAPQPVPAPDAGMDDRGALLLIRAMIAAANADGVIDADERQRILGKLDEAGINREDRALIEREIQSPEPLDTLLKEVDSPELAEQFYVASRLAIRPDSEADRSYLQYLASRLKLDPSRIAELNRVIG